MGLVSTRTPIFDDVPSIEFFNGRLLSGEDLSTEQTWNNARRNLLGQASGSGIANGLQVSLSNKAEFSGQPIVSVDAGLALNQQGEVLQLQQRTDVSLAQVDIESAPPVEFVDCQPTQFGVSVQSEGVYLLALCPASGTQGRAPVGGLANNEARCNRKYRRQGVQFRLHQLKLSAAELSDRDRLRNLVAYKIFNPDTWKRFVTDPFADQTTSTSFLDGQLIPELENCEVPLATIYWTLDGGIEYVDLWSVRRLLKPLKEKATSILSDFNSVHTVEAQILQFQEHLANLMEVITVPGTMKARDYFHFLPPAGLIRIISPGSKGVSANTFFQGLTVRYPHPPDFDSSAGPVFMEGARVDALMSEALQYPAISTASKSAIYLYRIRENYFSSGANSESGHGNYIVFTTGHMPYFASPRFDISRWNFSNYSSGLTGPDGL